MPRQTPPTGDEVRDKARAATLDHAKAGKGEKRGKKAKLTPADLKHLRGVQDLEQGDFIGVLETEIEGASLQPGTYNMFIAKVGNDWKVYAESNGQIVAETSYVTERPNAPQDGKPKFREGSFCWWMWLIVIGFEWCF